MSTTPPGPDEGRDQDQPPYGQQGASSPSGEPYGQAPYGQQGASSPSGEPYGQAPYGQQDQYGQQSWGRQPHGQDQYGQPWGEDQYGQPPYGQGQYGHPPYQPPSSDDRTIAVLAHLSPIIAIIFSAGLLSFLGPLVVWFIWRDRGPLIRNAAASAFNFNITVWVVGIIAWVCLITVILIPLAIVLWIGAFVAQVALSIKGAVRASRGEVYRYPLQVPILH